MDPQPQSLANSAAAAPLERRGSGTLRLCVSMLLALAVLAATAWPLVARATAQSWSFSATVTEINPGAAGFPAALSGLTLGQTISGVLSYDNVPVPTAGGLGGVFDLASRYTTPVFAFTLNTPGGSLSNWPSAALNTFVWNNQVLFSAASDGVLFMNRPTLPDPYFQFGNLLYPTSTLSSQAMPQASLLAGMAFEAGQNPAQPWLRAQGSALIFTPVPEPGAWALLAVGLAGVAWRRLKAAEPIAV